ncbi:SWIM zinc finger family protein [Novosphingobium sp. KACC 22771]|uniref:SWIM zinc finger family protein n=1 Tax=Novosphingobium sp. KACC 22771 TaxID=3025670 RepID=UPI003FD3F817
MSNLATTNNATTSGADTCTCQTYGYVRTCKHRLALYYAIEPEAPKAQAPSPTCPFIISTMSKIYRQKQRTASHP